MGRTSSGTQTAPCELTFIGNATVLIRCGGFALLTDPNFLHKGQRAHLGYGLTSVRLKAPAITARDLLHTDLDAVVLSHLHEDHWDLLAEQHLSRRLPVLTPPAAARALIRRGFPHAVGLRTWESRILTKGDRSVRFTAMPGRHGPGPLARLLPPVMGTLLEFCPSGGDTDLRMYISGDTLMYKGLAEIPARHPGIDVGIVHLGGTTLPFGLMVTMDGRQGADWLETIACSTAVPVHYDDYTVQKSPLSDFQREVERRGLADRVHVVVRGQTVSLPTGQIISESSQQIRATPDSPRK
jgi:L-ascorbate metabolism protein UlaG (beta-lactamase superfamily)